MTGLLVAAPFFVAGLYCLLRWSQSGQQPGRHRATGGDNGGRLSGARVLAEQRQATEDRQAHMRAAVAEETGRRR